MNTGIILLMAAYVFSFLCICLVQAVKKKSDFKNLVIHSFLMSVLIGAGSMFLSVIGWVSGVVIAHLLFDVRLEMVMYMYVFALYQAIFFGIGFFVAFLNVESIEEKRSFKKLMRQIFWVIAISIPILYVLTQSKWGF